MARRRKTDPNAPVFQMACKKHGLAPGTSQFKRCLNREAFSVNPQVNRQIREATERDKKVCAARGLVEKGSKAQRRAFWDCVGDLGEEYIERVRRGIEQRRKQREGR